MEIVLDGGSGCGSGQRGGRGSVLVPPSLASDWSVDECLSVCLSVLSLSVCLHSLSLSALSLSQCLPALPLS